MVTRSSSEGFSRSDCKRCSRTPSSLSNAASKSCAIAPSVVDLLATASRAIARAERQRCHGRRAHTIRRARSPCRAKWRTQLHAKVSIASSPFAEVSSTSGSSMLGCLSVSSWRKSISVTRRPTDPAPLATTTWSSTASAEAKETFDFSNHSHAASSAPSTASTSISPLY